MRLSRIEVFGFKSFGRKVTLEFTSQITAIVGPNGSGKSNVAESIRFVLGEQSMKSMRGKRGEDLIFNGSQTAGRANRASVTIVFDNTKREFAVDFDEVAITREVYRDGANQYFINGSQVRLKDIFELLAAVHIGASGHHMISQGEADRILSANPKERREMLEDALGLKVYLYKRTESERRLEKTEENMREAETLRREIAPHLRFLKKQVEKVNEGRALRDRLIGLYREYLKREEIVLEHRRSELAGRKSEPEAKLSELDREIEASREVLSKESAADEKSHRLLEVEAKLRGARAKKDELSRTIGRVEGMIEFEQRQLAKKRAQAERKEDIQVRLATFEELASEIEGDIAGMEGNWDAGALRDALYRLRDRVRGFIARTKEQAGQTPVGPEDEEEIRALEGEKRNADAALEAMRADVAKMEEEYAAVKSEIDQEKERSRDTERMLFEMVSRRGEVASELGRIRSEEESLARDLRRLDEELTEAGVLLGRAVLDYSSIALAPEEVIAEPREEQERRRREIERGKIRLEDIGAQGGEDVVKEYEETLERDLHLEREMADLAGTAESLRALIAELTEKLDIEFKDGVKKINTQFEEFFRLMFGGGVAALDIVKIEKRKRRDTDIDLSDVPGDAGDDEEGDAEDEEEGVDIRVSLPHKKIRGLQMLSGGERALTSIALLFAISQVNPPPFMVLDETDAALDEANSRKYGDMIENLAKLSQLLVITHNRETMSRAGVLYGVTMGSDAVSKVLSIAFEDAQAVAK
ncbi:MAG TPA: AAA family ATPase [Candidatus Paceibacterota bacterium]|nr:AAA family ATPase [Candidatus Paceibacterota bacterium]